VLPAAMLLLALLLLGALHAGLTLKTNIKV
jgi:hypothetical protein